MFDTKRLTRAGLVAAIYIVLTLNFPWMGYGPIQFRISEVMVLLAFFDPIYIGSITLGCAIANLASPFGIADVIFGSFASFISLYMINKSKNIYIASIWPAVFSFIIGLEMYFLSSEPVNFFLVTFQIMLSEIVIVSFIGVPIFKMLTKNSYFLNLIKGNTTNINQNI